jgi:hypothetical protein
MTDSVIPAGTYTLLEFKLRPVISDSEIGEAAGFDANENTFENQSVDIKKIIHTWSLSESMTKGHISGSAKVYDAEGIFYNYPIRGQERITITYRDYFGDERTEEMFLFSVTDIQTPKKSDDSVLGYTIHFVSWGKFWSERFMVSRCIANGTRSGRRYIPVSEQVDVLFEDYYRDNDQGTKKEITIHETESEQQIVIPNMRPEAAMHLMSRRAYSINYPSSYYRFFEARNGYNFVNMEQLNAGTAKKKYQYVSGATDTTPQAEIIKMNQIIDLAFQSPFDTLDALKFGAYNRKLNEVDVTNRRVNAYEYKHNEEYFEYIYPGQNTDINMRHTDKFIDAHLNNWAETYVIKDYPDDDMSNANGLRTKTYYGQIHNHKNSHYYDYKMTRMNIKVYGSNRLFVGDLIDLEFPYFSTYANIDVERSGTYIIESVNNVFYEDTYIQELVVSRGPIGDV